MELRPHCVLLILNVWMLIFSLMNHSLSYWELFSLSSQTGFDFVLSFDHALKLYFVFWVGKKLQRICYAYIQTSYPPPTCTEIQVHFLPLLVNTGMTEFLPFCSSFVFHDAAARHCCFLLLPQPSDQEATFLIYKRVYFCIITGWVSKAHVPLLMSFTLLCGLLGSDAASGDMRTVLVFSTKLTIIYE